MHVLHHTSIALLVASLVHAGVNSVYNEAIEVRKKTYKGVAKQVTKNGPWELHGAQFRYTGFVELKIQRSAVLSFEHPGLRKGKAKAVLPFNITRKDDGTKRGITKYFGAVQSRPREKGGLFVTFTKPTGGNHITLKATMQPQTVKCKLVDAWFGVDMETLKAAPDGQFRDIPKFFGLKRESQSNGSDDSLCSLSLPSLDHQTAKVDRFEPFSSKIKYQDQPCFVDGSQLAVGLWDIVCPYQDVREIRATISINKGGHISLALDVNKYSAETTERPKTGVTMRTVPHFFVNSAIDSRSTLKELGPKEKEVKVLVANGMPSFPHEDFENTLMSLNTPSSRGKEKVRATIRLDWDGVKQRLDNEKQATRETQETQERQLVGV